MRNTFGHWLLDIAKYLVTAGVIAPFVSNGLQWYGILIVAIVVIVLLIIGLRLVKEETKIIKRRK
ncbi:MAG: hypothetical protein MJZ75_04725 [Paludibacteraceae bacterium]|nr:hypothetical protein [Paludibacteraceae bacterium]